MTAATETPVYGPEPMEKPKGGKRGGGQTTTPTVGQEEATSRFLQFLIPVAASAASTFGPQIGSAIGGLFGGSEGAKTGGQIGGTVGGILGNLGGGINLGGLFGGRSFPPELLAQLTAFDDGADSVDLTGPMVQQCTLQCLTKLTPDLVTMLGDIQPKMQSGGEGDRSADVEIAALERFWPEIGSFLTHQVATHLPDIIKTVTGTVIPLLGTRDTAQFTPMLTGAETNARWFVPVLTSVMTAVQQCLPQLLDALSGESRAARDTSITWTDISVYGRFWDRDFIRVVGQEDLPDKNVVHLVLELAPHLSWAKQIHIRDDNGTVISRLHVQDARKLDEAVVASDQILTNGSLLFAKAKLFGIVTGMYVLPTAGLDVLKGKRTHIRWMSD